MGVENTKNTLKIKQELYTNKENVVRTSFQELWRQKAEKERIIYTQNDRKAH
jgi:hypothetical protein